MPRPALGAPHACCYFAVAFFTKDAKVSPQLDAGYCGHQEARVTQAIARIHLEAFVLQEAAEERVYAGVFAFFRELAT